MLGYGIGAVYQNQQTQQQAVYKVEINRIYHSLSEGVPLERLDLSSYQYVKHVEFLGKGESSKDKVEKFYELGNDYKPLVMPWYQENLLVGYLRFDYQEKENQGQLIFYAAEIALLIMELAIMVLLFYLKQRVLVPFHRINDLPYELAKGHLHGEIKQEKSRYFGKFLWGISLLKDNLDVTKRRELELAKEKKLLLLSLSHDIKTPLNMIQLYGKAIEHGIYDTEEQIQHASHQIGEKTIEIEQFIEEIMKNSREDLLGIEVEKGEFYLKDLMQAVLKDYGEKCAIRMVRLEVEHYENRLLSGDMERSREVMENLLENAFKYGDGRQIRISFYEEDYCQMIRIYNTGEAVTDTEFNHIFESFYRGGNSKGKKGSGLGLYICREVMHKMEGEIFAEKLEDGMAFVLVFR